MTASTCSHGSLTGRRPVARVYQPQKARQGGKALTSFQRGVLLGVSCFAVVFHLFCFALCEWNDYQMEKEGISIERILADKGGKR